MIKTTDHELAITEEYTSVEITEYDLVAGAIIYLFYNGFIVYTTEEIYKLEEEIAAGNLKDEVIKKIVELNPYHQNELNISKDSYRSTLSDLIPFYILQKKDSTLTIQLIEEARVWVKRNPDIKEINTIGAGYCSHSVWINEEIPPHTKQVNKELIEDALNWLAAPMRKAKDLVYNGKPREVFKLIPTSPNNTLLFCSALINILSYPTNIKDQFLGNKEYPEVIIELGEICIKILPNVINKVVTPDDLFSLSENSGMVNYARLLEGLEMYKQALYVCEECIKYKIHDGTVRGFRGRAKRLQIQIKKNRTPEEIKEDKLAQKKTPRKYTGRKSGKTPKVADSQILELVTKYLSSNSAQRKQLAIEYDITSSNMSYIVSKNRHRIE